MPTGVALYRGQLVPTRFALERRRKATKCEGTAGRLFRRRTAAWKRRRRCPRSAVWLVREAWAGPWWRFCGIHKEAFRRRFVYVEIVRLGRP